MSHADRFTFDLKQPTRTAAAVLAELSNLRLVAGWAAEYDDLVRRYADDNGVLPDGKAVEAAELAHKIYVELSWEADHYRRLSMEHREGTPRR
ncbi:hypothetical protein ADK67_44955 [Saccharothrix sp. NRRL B-16348]|uniref:hypothetical protein n=1 Tax=Saccharothrix sp. NRRL B-16348 TaxID=1415542 RepID=UPI0006AD9D0D|nr:hypothetical protein [Saccharothrix sp. NRRL B-16348]KOX12785.1 hypothetical protein ADK67_44955 [Saccharothrix sp. NRRL B-16348]